MIHSFAADHTVTRLCCIFSVTRAGYYAWKQRQINPSKHDLRDAELTAEIRAIHKLHPGYGSPRIHAELKRRHRMQQEASQQAGNTPLPQTLLQASPCSKHRVARLMQKATIRSVRIKQKRRIKTTDSNHNQKVAANLLNRNFTADAPDQRWVADTTYVPTRCGWLFLSVILDLFSRKVVGWSTGSNFTSELVCRTLHNALHVRQRPLLLHSDRGVQYASDAYQALLQNSGIQCSMSRKGNCYDNAVVESFFASLKTELIDHVDFANLHKADQQIFGWIEGYYNLRRIHSTLDYLTPVEFERAHRLAVSTHFA